MCRSDCPELIMIVRSVNRVVAACVFCAWNATAFHPRVATIPPVMVSSDKGSDGFWRLLGVFLRLGATSFGGPSAHLALFRAEFVERRGWLTDARYAELVAFCQALPGPRSSQVALLVGKERGGWLGAMAAWLGFTLPGAVTMAAMAMAWKGVGGVSDWIRGLQAFAVAVVAHAVWSMARSLAPDTGRRIVVLVAAAVCWIGGGAGQLAAIAIGAAAGALLGAGEEPTQARSIGSRKRETLCLTGFVALLAVAFLLRGSVDLAGLAAGVFRAGSMVFGGGHVVLPLLRTEVVRPSGMPESVFLAGYGLVQGMPGPLFNIAAWLGASQGGWAGAAIATIAIFLPGALLAIGAQPIWDRLGRWRVFRKSLRGVNAAVVGILLAALVFHVAPAGVGNWREGAICAAALAAISFARWPTWCVALGCAAIGWTIG